MPVQVSLTIAALLVLSIALADSPKLRPPPSELDFLLFNDHLLYLAALVSAPSSPTSPQNEA
jgi:hypothetical protein